MFSVSTNRLRSFWPQSIPLPMHSPWAQERRLPSSESPASRELVSRSASAHVSRLVEQVFHLPPTIHRRAQRDLRRDRDQARAPALQIVSEPPGVWLFPF